MSEPADRTWTMTFPIEATVFVVTLIAIVLIGALSFFFAWERSLTAMQGGGFDSGFGIEEDFEGRVIDVTPVIPTSVP